MADPPERPLERVAVAAGSAHESPRRPRLRRRAARGSMPGHHAV